MERRCTTVIKDKMIVVEDDGDDLLEQEHVCSECNYLHIIDMSGVL